MTSNGASASLTSLAPRLVDAALSWTMVRNQNAELSSTKQMMHAASILLRARTSVHPPVHPAPIDAVKRSAKTVALSELQAANAPGKLLAAIA